MYLVKYSMFKFMLEWYKDYIAVKAEMEKMGIFYMLTPWGAFHHLDKELYERYLKNDRSDTVPEDNRQP